MSGVIEETYFAGQDSRWGNKVNAFVLKLEDGSRIEESIYVNHRKDAKLFVPGARVKITYAFDELKRQSDDGSPSYLDIVLEMAVSSDTAG